MLGWIGHLSVKYNMVYYGWYYGNEVRVTPVDLVNVSSLQRGRCKVGLHAQGCDSYKI